MTVSQMFLEIKLRSQPHSSVNHITTHYQLQVLFPLLSAGPRDI